MQKVIVTGGAGYIGSHTVVELAQAGYEPVIIDNYSNSQRSVEAAVNEIVGKSLKWYDVDCRDKEKVRRVFESEGKIAGVLHFAAFKAVGESVQKPLKYFENNIGSFTTLLEVMAEFDVKELVFSSSCTVYGEPEVNPVTESTPWQPASSPYGYTKQVCERLIQDLDRSPEGIRAAMLRYFNPIGAHPSALIGELPLGTPNNLVPYLTQVAAGLRPKLTIFGDDYPTPDGTCVRDYIHVVDLAKAHVSALDYIFGQTPGESFNLIANIGTGTGASVREVVEGFEKATGVPVPHEVGPRRPGDVSQIFAASTGAASQLDWTPELSLEQALADAWRWQTALLKAKEKPGT